MGMFSRRSPRGGALTATGLSALTAAASEVQVESSRAAAAWYEKRQEEWVLRAWEFYNLIPEVGYASRYFANGLARLTPFPAIRPDAYAEPVPLEDKGDSKLGYTAADTAAAKDALARLKNPHGDVQELLRRLGVQFSIPGEALLMGRDDPDFGERWDIYSTRELIQADGKWKLMAPGGQSKVLAEFVPADVTVVRLWRPHPEWTTWADSPMRSAEMILDELLILTKAIRAVALSRAAGAGILFLPNSMRNQIANATDGTSGGQSAARDSVIADMITATATAISDPGSAASQVPVTVWVPDSIYSEIGTDKLVQWSREIDTVMETQREALLRRFATATDLPAEVLTGMSNMNHWSAWAIPDAAFRDHFEPAAVLAFNGLTTSYFRPALAASDVVDTERFVLWYDPSGLVSPPDQSTDYQDAYDRFEVSGAAYRRALGISDEEAPDAAEIADRIARGQRPKGAVPETQPSTPAPVSIPGAQVAALTEGANTVTFDLTVPSAEVVAIPQLAETIARMDSALFAAMLVSADAALRRALERANARLKSLAQSQAKLRGFVSELVPSDLGVAPALGSDRVVALAKDEDLFAGAFAALGLDFAKRTGRTIEETIRLARIHGDLSDTDAEVLLEQSQEDRNHGWALLLAALTAIAAEKLYRPLPDEGPGEVTDQLVPPAIVRGALSRAGGGGSEAVSMLTGATVSSLFTKASIRFRGWRWAYGDPSARSRPFEPHENLDGVKISGPDDPRLEHASSFPPGNYWIGDHRGCLCNLERVAAVKVSAGTIVGDREVA